MNGMLKALYYAFYNPIPDTELKKEVEDCHQLLIETLDKPSRRLVLRVIDAKDHITEDISIDSFIAGFTLAWQMCNEVSDYRQCNRLWVDNER